MPTLSDAKAQSFCKFTVLWNMDKEHYESIDISLEQLINRQIGIFRKTFQLVSGIAHLSHQNKLNWFVKVELAIHNQDSEDHKKSNIVSSQNTIKVFSQIKSVILSFRTIFELNVQCRVNAIGIECKECVSTFEWINTLWETPGSCTMKLLSALWSYAAYSSSVIGEESLGNQTSGDLVTRGTPCRNINPDDNKLLSG